MWIPHPTEFNATCKIKPTENTLMIISIGFIFLVFLYIYNTYRGREKFLIMTLKRVLDSET